MFQETVSLQLIDCKCVVWVFNSATVTVKFYGIRDNGVKINFRWLTLGGTWGLVQIKATHSTRYKLQNIAITPFYGPTAFVIVTLCTVVIERTFTGLKSRNIATM